MKGGKPKNDGQVLTVRVGLVTHAAISQILQKWALEGRVPSQRTKAAVIEAAVLSLLDHEAQT